VCRIDCVSRAEDAAPSPLQVYGRWKLEGEERVRAAGGEHVDQVEYAQRVEGAEDHGHHQGRA